MPNSHRMHELDTQSFRPHNLLLVAVSPRVNTTVSGPDVRVRLRFNLRIDQKHSRLRLLGGDARERELRIRNASPADELVSEALGLKDGSYAVEWLVRGSHGKVTRGQVTFRVGESD